MPDFIEFSKCTGTYSSAKFEILTETANAKVNKYDEWSLKVDKINFFDGVRGAGIAFAPMKGTSKGGNTQWRKYTGVGYAGYGSSGGVVTTYRLGARMDDSLTGITHAEGYWNADYVTW